MKLVNYPSNESASHNPIQGTYFELDNEEYVQVEVNDSSSAVVLWSSTLSLTALIKHVRSLAGSPSAEDDGGYVRYSSGERIESSSVQAEQTAQAKPDTVQMFVAAYGKNSISWQEAHIKMQGGSRKPSECSLAGEEIDFKLLSDLIRETATPEVKEAVALENIPLRQTLGKTAVVS